MDEDFLYAWLMIGLFCVIVHFDFAKPDKCPKLDWLCVVAVVWALFDLRTVWAICGIPVGLYLFIAIFCGGMNSKSTQMRQ